MADLVHQACAGLLEAGPGGRGHTPRPVQNSGYAGTGPRPAQVSQISWPRCTLLGVALHACPAAQISGTGIVVPR